jgi:hypothetical protein
MIVSVRSAREGQRGAVMKKKKKETTHLYTSINNHNRNNHHPNSTAALTALGLTCITLSFIYDVPNTRARSLRRGEERGRWFRVGLGLVVDFWKSGEDRVTSIAR